jgi:hypothetical protein
VSGKSRSYNIGIEFVTSSVCIGAFWKRTGNCIDVWVCPLPCVMIHVSWWWNDAKQN